MDDKTLKSQKEKLEKLNREVDSLVVKERGVRAKIDDEKDIAHKANAQRVVLLAQLVDAKEDVVAKLHKQIDGLDTQIKTAERMAEGYERLLKATETELASVTAERGKVNESVAVENTARAFQAWTIQVADKFKAAREAMLHARLAVGELCMESARGGERFGHPAYVLLGSEWDVFTLQQANPETYLGLKTALPFYRNVKIVVSPMSER